MAETFSCTELFRASYFLKTRRNIGKTTAMTTTRITTRKGSIPRKISDMRHEMRSVMMTAKTTMRGTRTATRISMPKAFCTLVTSVVMRVTREEVEKESMSLKEKPWTRKNRSWRRFLASPAAAVAEKRAARTPHASDAIAMATSARPMRSTGPRSSPPRRSTRVAMISGSRHSSATSPTMNSGVSKEARLYSRSLPMRMRMVSIYRPLPRAALRRAVSSVFVVFTAPCAPAPSARSRSRCRLLWRRTAPGCPAVPPRGPGPRPLPAPLGRRRSGPALRSPVPVSARGGGRW